jgi:hypothetical protein
MEGVQVKNRTLVAIPLKMGLLLVPLGCGSPTGLQPSESCRGQPDNTVVTFEDANLEAEIREGFEIFGEIGPRDDLTCGLLSRIEGFIGDSTIRSLVGIQNLTSLTYLAIDFNAITDISPLSELTSLTQLSLDFNLITDISALSGLTSLTLLSLTDNSITDISPLSGLTSLMQLSLWGNSITDISSLSGLASLTQLGLFDNPGLSNIQPLLDNTGFGAGDVVGLSGTNVSCTDVALLEAKGVTVESDCP